MNIIDFFKAFFRLSKNETQDSSKTSNLDLANAQHEPIDYASTAEREQSLFEKKNDELADDVVPAVEIPISHDESIDELKAFVDKIDTENLSITQNPQDTVEGVEGHLKEQADTERLPASLLDNAPYMSLAESCCELFKELEKQQSEDNSELIDLIKNRIKEGLFLSGAEPIAEETSYDVIRHTAVGKSIVRKGTPITSTLEPGVAIDDKVMIKAKVQL